MTQKGRLGVWIVIFMIVKCWDMNTWGVGIFTHHLRDTMQFPQVQTHLDFIIKWKMFKWNGIHLFIFESVRHFPSIYLWSTCVAWWLTYFQWDVYMYIVYNLSGTISYKASPFFKTQKPRRGQHCLETLLTQFILYIQRWTSHLPAIQTDYPVHV